MTPEISGIMAHNLLDEHTEGAFYALQYTATHNGWAPHTWAQPLPHDRTRFIFYATDEGGLVRYFDHMTIENTENLTEQMMFFERQMEAQTVKARIQIGLTRLDVGLDPVPNRIDTDHLN